MQFDEKNEKRNKKIVISYKILFASTSDNAIKCIKMEVLQKIITFQRLLINKHKWFPCLNVLFQSTRNIYNNTIKPTHASRTKYTASNYSNVQNVADIDGLKRITNEPNASIAATSNSIFPIFGFGALLKFEKIYISASIPNFLNPGKFVKDDSFVRILFEVPKHLFIHNI